MSDTPTHRDDLHDPGPPPADDLDSLLRQWHETNRHRAAAGRDDLLEALRQDRVSHDDRAPRRRAVIAVIGRVIMSRHTHAAASLAVLVCLAVLFVQTGTRRARGAEIMVPDGGRLEALDEAGRLIGPCPLEHTDVNVAVSGPFTRVTLTQRYANPYDQKIEAVYTFPMSHRAAVDRMTMTIGDRVVVGEVKERGEARRIYEAARASGYVASLLEQERPNIFTQSVANIEPRATVVVEISYVEVLQSRDGEYTFDFPMVVGPRYIPGSSRGTPSLVPAELVSRHGVILRGPAQLTLGQPGDVETLGSLQVGKLQKLLGQAMPVDYPGARWWGEGEDATLPEVWYPFQATYCDGAKEIGWLYVDGTGQINGRWFYTDPRTIASMSTGFSADTDQVPDASRITPMPVRPGQRAGHDIALTMTIDSGGPGLLEFASPLHEIVTRNQQIGDDGRPRRVVVELASRREIPNRDFVLSWRLADDAIQEAHFVHRGPHGGFFTLLLQPPDRIEDAMATPRELVFVLDRSGSMSGFPITKAKDVMTRAIDSMRERDTFNVITFAGHTAILWDQPRPGTPENRAAARAFVESQQGGGGTEMMNAIEAALVQRPTQQSESLTPRDRIDTEPPMRLVMFLTDGYVGNDNQIIEAVRANAGTTRVFSFGIGNSVNRHLLEGMARAGRGEVEFVLLESDADAAVERFTRRIATPVLTNIVLDVAGVEVTDTIPPLDAVPDLFDQKPLIIHGRYTRPGRGSLTISGRTGAGRYERRLDLELPANAPDHDVIGTLWARARVDELTPAGDPRPIIALGEQFQIMTEYTSFVAVEKSRMTVDGKPMLVAVPIEMPDGVSYEGIFGGVKDATEGDVAGAAASLGLSTIANCTFTDTLGKPISRTLAAKDSVMLDESNVRFTLVDAQDIARGYDNEALGRESFSIQNLSQLQQQRFVPNINTVFESSPELDLDSALGQSNGLGGGGSIFGDPSGGNETVILTGLERQEAVINLVATLNEPDAWDFHGGELATMRYDQSGLQVLPLQDSEEARAAVEATVAYINRFGAHLLDTAQPTPPDPGEIDGIPIGYVEPAKVPADSATTSTVVYDVRDLIRVSTGDPPRPDELDADLLWAVTSLIREAVAPDGWAAHGGDTGFLEQLDGKLFVRNTADSHRAIQILLTQLRLALEAPIDEAWRADAQARQVLAARAADPDGRLVVIHDVRDIVGFSKAATVEEQQQVPHWIVQDLIDLIVEAIDPDNWDINGGEVGSTWNFQGLLIVKHTIARQLEVIELLDSLREAYGMHRPPAIDEDTVLDRETLTRLARVLDQRLWPVVPALAQHVPTSIGTTLPRLRDEIVVSLLTADRDAETIDTLTEHGLTIEDRSESINHVVGTIAPDRLVDLALLESVRRIEPVNWD